MFVDKQTVLSATNNGFDIIKLYYPECDQSNPKKKFSIRREGDPSACLVFQDIWFIKDFGDSNKAINPIQLVMDQENLDFNQALNFIVDRLKLNIEHTTFIRPEPIIKKTLYEQEAPTWKTKSFTKYELEILGPRVDEDLCKRYKLYSLESYTTIKGIMVSSTDKYPIFLYDYGNWQKVYQPLAEKQYRFMYFGIKPKGFIYGLKQVKDFVLAQADQDGSIEDENDFEKVDMIIKANGDRDALNIAADGYLVVWTDSEAVLLSYEQYKEGMKYCNILYNLPDIDEPGKRYAQQLALRFMEIRTIWLPESLKDFRDTRGNPCKDFTDFVKKFNNPYTYLKKLITSALPIQFWDKVWNEKFKKFNIIFFNSRFYEFLKFNGFYRYPVLNNKEGFIYIHEQNKVVSQIRPSDIRNFIDRFMVANHYNENIRDFIYRTNQFNEASLSRLDYKEFDFTSYGQDFQYFFFKNASWKVTKDGVEQLQLSQFEKNIWNYSLQDFHVKKLEPLFKVTYSDKYKTLTESLRKAKKDEDRADIQENLKSIEDFEKFDLKINDTDFSFLKFMHNTSRIYWRKQEIENENLNEKEVRIQNLHLINKLYTLGYLLHQYKDPAKPWAVFGMDVSDVEFGRHEGGSGKSLTFKSIRMLLNTVNLDGMNKDITTYPHIFELVTKDTDYLLVDDCSPFMDFKFFFAKLTGELTVNPKRTTQFEIPYKDVCKFAFTLNGALRNMDGSSKRRILFTAFSDYYHEKDNHGRYEVTRTPATEFGKNLIDDYTQDEMNKLYNLFANCISLYLSYPKIDPPMDDLQRRNYRLDMGETFLEWAEEFFINPEKCNCNLIKKEIYKEFQEKIGWKDNLTSFEKNKYKESNFKKHLNLYAYYSNMEFNPPDIKGYDKKHGRIMVKIDGVTTECIYMRNINGPGHAPEDDLPF